MDWHALEIKEVFAELKTTNGGLNFEEAQKRLAKCGRNKLPAEKRLTRIKIFLSQFKSPLIYILLFAVVVTVFWGNFVDAVIILVIIFLNTLIGYFQENKAERTIAKLKEVLEYRAKVFRDGQEQEIDVAGIVPGDIFIIEAGDRVPADGRIIEEKNLQISEAVLTGESIPSSKSSGKLEVGTPLSSRENMVYMGTTVIRGRGVVVAVNTGLQTEFGKIAQLVKETDEEQTPLQRQLALFSRWLAAVIAILAVVLFVIGLLQGRSLTEMFLISVAVAVASVPEGLVIALTIILAVGMQKIFKEKVLVRKLIAAETLGSTSVICSDKTGTLTEGKMMVDRIITETQSENSRMKVLEIGLLCNNAVIENPEDALKDWRIFGDSTEQALLLAGVQSGEDWLEVRNNFPRLDEIPFDEEKKIMATLHEVGGKKEKRLILVKGAPERIMALSANIETDDHLEKFDAGKIKKFKKELDDLTGSGLRVLAVAYKKVADGTENFNGLEINDLVFVGLVALKDPLRADARAAIELCRKASIKPILVTGDHRLTAKMVAAEIGLRASEKNILEGDSLDKINDEEFSKILKNIDVYARVMPKHKLRIIDAWQKGGEVVAMTGDGVNDAPALKKADVGVALGSGTDVAKEVADIVLLDDSFRAMVEAVRRGRTIFENIKKVVTYFLADGFCEFILVGGGLLLGTPLPVLAVQILWVNLVEDSLPAIALAFEPVEKDLMKDKPRRKHAPLLNPEMKVIIFLIGVLTDFFILILFCYLWKKTGNLAYSRTMTFVGLGIDSLFFIWSCRSLRFSIWQTNPFSNRFLNLSVLAGFFMLAIAVYLPGFRTIMRTVPLNFGDWIILLGLGLLNIILIEIVKYIFIVRRKKYLVSSI